MVIGTILLVIGLTGIVFSIVQFGGLVEGLLDPGEDALETLTFDEAGSKNVMLEEGEYEVWREEGDDLGDLAVTDEEGNSVFQRDESQTITIDRPGSRERTYEKVGDLEIKERGNHTFETDESCTLYVTESRPFFDSFTSILFFIVVVGCSVFGMVVGAVLVAWSWLDKKDCPYCGKTVSKDALRCKHCERDLTQRNRVYDQGVNHKRF